MTPPNWPATTVTMRPISDLIPHARNPRTHSQEQVKQIADSITEWGWTVPILVDEGGGIIAGHGRILAAEALGIEDVPCMVASDWSDEQKRAYVIADNQLTLNGEWDRDLLALEVGELNDLDFDVSLLGIDKGELDSLLSGPGGDITEDEVPDVDDVEPVANLGDIWKLGRHRVMCGDSTSAEDVGRLMAGEKAQMVFTDPPYGVNCTGGAKERDELKGDHIGTDIYAESLRHLGFAVDDKAALYLWYADGYTAAVAAAVAAAGYVISAQIIWAKNHAQFVTSAHYKGKHESCYYAHRKGKSTRWHGENNEVTLWEYPRSPVNEYHPTQKPVELVGRAIRNSSLNGEAVLDIFLGSGATLIAAEQLNRTCYGMEISPRYVDVIIARWEALTGEKAELLEAGGVDFIQ